MKIYIDANCPKYRGAPRPLFNKLMLNEQMFEDELRCKEFYAEFDDITQKGEVEWLSQESNKLTENAEKELIRAFKANGAYKGAIISINFGTRDHGLNNHLVLTVD